MKALITGASEGIGRSFAKKLAAEGYIITAVARNRERLEALVAELGGTPHSFLVADLSSDNGIQDVGERLTLEKFDLLINNAGYTVYNSFHGAPLIEIEKIMRVNCEALLELSHAFLRGAKAGDALINVSSTASLVPMPVTSIYTATKCFVTSLSENLWYEERKRGVYVMALCPGTTMTEFHTRAGGHNRQIPRWAAQTPDQVVDRALGALKRRRLPVVVCGPQRPILWLARFLPRKLVTILSGRVLEWALGS